MCNLFDTPDVPEPPLPAAEAPNLDPEEAARRRAARMKQNVTRDTLVIDQGVTGRGNSGTGLRIGGQ